MSTKGQKRLGTNKCGAPKTIFDDDAIRAAWKLARIQCTWEEIASILECHIETLKNNDKIVFAVNKGKEQGKQSIRRAQYKAALKGNPAMMIWLGKQYLGQVDKYEGNYNHNVTVNELSDSQLASIASQSRKGTHTAKSSKEIVH